MIEKIIELYKNNLFFVKEELDFKHIIMISKLVDLCIKRYLEYKK